MSLSYASRHTRRVPGSTSCVRRCVGVARAAREGLPPLGDGLRTPRRASKRASSATKAPQRSPRGTRPSSPPPRPGGTRTEPRRTRPQALRQPRALDAGPRSCCPRISTNENPAFARALTTVDPPQKYETIANDTGWSRGRSRRVRPSPGTSARDGVGQGLGWDGVGGVARARETTPAGETRAKSGLSAPPRS